MAGYYDSSLLLAVILGQCDPGVSAEVWDTETIRLSSLLIKAECTVGVRRIALAGGHTAGSGWAVQRITALDEYLDTLTLKPVDDSIEMIIRKDTRLSACRTLDAVHLATAVYFQSHLEEPLRICSLDKRLRDVATLLGFEIRPG